MLIRCASIISYPDHWIVIMSYFFVTLSKNVCGVRNVVLLAPMRYRRPPFNGLMTVFPLPTSILSPGFIDRFNASYPCLNDSAFPSCQIAAFCIVTAASPAIGATISFGPPTGLTPVSGAADTGLPSVPEA